jgi:ribulose-5-phosphate 4-epimerase/fuculose-1-phosphate aldolase
MKWLFDTSSALGSDIDLVQGTGGNISVKLDERRMAIKASGVRLKDAAIGCYVVVDYKQLARLYSGQFSEEDTDYAVASSIAERSAYGPSIETGFHSFLGKYVIHLHPASFNLILCSKSSRKLVEEIFKNSGFLYVPYKKVGHFVSVEINKLVEKHGVPEIIFLENHGIILSSERPEACLETLAACRNLLSAYLSALDGHKPFEYSPLRAHSGGFLHNSDVVVDYVKDLRNSDSFLFPDAAVFTSHLFSEKRQKLMDLVSQGMCYKMNFQNASNIDEILSAHVYLVNAIKNFSEPRCLEKKDVQALLGMQAEKRRIEMSGI